jgi:hypothetical protein
MVRDALAVLLTVAVFVGGGCALAATFRWQVRRFNRAVATDPLNDWQERLELLDDEQRRRALLSPPANVVAAMAALPGPGLAAGWDERPVASLGR